MLIILQLLIVLAMIFIGAKVGGIGLGIYGMVGVSILVFVFGLEPGSIPIDVMLIIVSVITASSALQAAGGMDYMVNVAVRFLKKHPSRITFLAPLVTWLFTLMTGTAHTCYALLPIISEIARKEKVRPERPLSIATIAASLGCTGSPVSAATAAIVSETLLGARALLWARGYLTTTFLLFWRQSTQLRSYAVTQLHKVYLGCDLRKKEINLYYIIYIIYYIII